VDEFLRRHAPGPAVPTSEQFGHARKGVLAATATLARVEDSALADPWQWRDGETEIRYGFYRLYELLEQGAADARGALSLAGEALPAAQAAAGAATAARWDLHGILVSLGDAELDRDPGGGEWSLRQTLAHVVNSQRAYGWFTAWWLARRDAAPDDFPPSVPDDAAPDFPDEATEGVGSLAAVRDRLDSVLDDCASVLGGLDEPSLHVRARWSGAAVDVGFRLGRWASHLREHTIQVEKTLASLGHAPSEGDRLVRLVLAAYGRLEATAFALPASLGRPAAAVLERTIRELGDVAKEASGAAGIAHSRSNR
jgi:uncharacterized damage-inducible protein DinB